MVANESLFASDPRVLAAAMKTAGLNETASQFLSHGSVTGDPTNAVLTFSYNAANGPRARGIANAWANAYRSAADLRDTTTLNAALKATQPDAEESDAAAPKASKPGPDN